VSRTRYSNSISSSPFTALTGSAVTESTSMRASYLVIASKTAVSTRVSIAVSMTSKARSWIPQPNSGRITRSPRAVSRMIMIDWRMSASYSAMATLPVSESTWTG
jgi:hypothetical protein